MNDKATNSELTTLTRQLSNEEIYITFWKSEQEHTRTRWTVVTFFIIVSFAIFGFSLQVQKPTIPIFVSHITALAIYWFAYLLFWRFNTFTNFMRSYLKEMEESG